MKIAFIFLLSFAIGVLSFWWFSSGPISLDTAQPGGDTPSADATSESGANSKKSAGVTAAPRVARGAYPKTTPKMDTGSCDASHRMCTHRPVLSPSIVFEEGVKYFAIAVSCCEVVFLPAWTWESGPSVNITAEFYRQIDGSFDDLFMCKWDHARTDVTLEELRLFDKDESLKGYNFLQQFKAFQNVKTRKDVDKKMATAIQRLKQLGLSTEFEDSCNEERVTEVYLLFLVDAVRSPEPFKTFLLEIAAEFYDMMMINGGPLSIEERALVLFRQTARFYRILHFFRGFFPS